MSPFRMLFAGAFLSVGSLMAASAVCPTTAGQLGTDASGTGCSLVITFGSSGPSVAATGLGPYDGSEDVTVGVINNTTAPLSTVTLTSSTGTDAFGFESDGIQTYASTNGVAIGTGGVTGYEGPDSTFDTTGVVAGDGTLVVNFSTAIAANGGFDYFSLEGQPSIGSGITVMPAPGTPGTPGTATPEPASLATLATGLVAFGGLALRRRRAL